jgi:hypothetical protein
VRPGHQELEQAGETNPIRIRDRDEDHLARPIIGREGGAVKRGQLIAPLSDHSAVARRARPRGWPRGVISHG